jgi:glycosyltransferase involved in cell wall biosynthesis
LNSVLLIPAYNPGPELVEVIEAVDANKFEAIVVINDGSDLSYSHVFMEVKDKEKVQLLDHAVNLGKGAALKTGMNFIKKTYPNSPGVVTADADGQHSPVDIVRVSEALAENQSSIVIGCRHFKGDIPLRSKFGNVLTRLLMRFFAGISLSDTQSGLRGIPMSLLGDIISSGCNKYEFEMDMLFIAKRLNVGIKEVEIETIYSDGNESSHFNPIADSMRIYFVMSRYLFASVLTALVDYIVFVLVMPFFGSITAATYIARGSAVSINFILVKKVVFGDHKKIMSTLPKYLLLVILSGFISLSIIHYLSSLGMKIILAKIVAESVLYLANFIIQKEFIFKTGDNK